MISAKCSYFMTFHVKLSSNYYSSQLVDMMCYELPVSTNSGDRSRSLISPQTTLGDGALIYNFHNLTSQERLLVFVTNLITAVKDGFSTSFGLVSVTELFPNASWLEREIAELHGILFELKRDIRNLMLQYGDNSTPFQKHFPSVGLQELFYDSRSDLITQRGVDLQN